MNRTSTFFQNTKHDFNIERFRTRLMAKFCVVFVAVTQIVLRLIQALANKQLNGPGRITFFITLPLFCFITLVVCFEYLLYRRIGPKVMKYSHLIDILLLIAFTGEWLAIVVNVLTRTSPLPPHDIALNSVFGFTSFGWRTIFLIFLNQNWKLIIIPPVLMISLVLGWVIYFATSGVIWILFMGFPQIFYVVMMLYFQDRIRWREVLTNVQQERWIQVNDFILNNIPENIVILELGHEVKFVSDYCKNFMRKVHLSQNPRDLFNSIIELNQQPETEPSSPSNNTSRKSDRDRFATVNVFLEPTTGHNNNFQNLDSLQDLIQNFKEVIKDADLQERQFLIYNGKLKVEAHHTKAIEIKVSYIQQHSKEYIVLIIRDTTQRDLLVTLEDNNKYKDQLLASVSHELRAPLNGNINLVESAIHNLSVPGHIKERLLTPALRSSKFLLHLINDILDMSQIKAQKLRLIFKSGKLQETLNDTLQLVELQAKKKNIELCLVIHSDVEDTICTDHVRLSQIVLNLLNNAIKFTQKGSVILSALPTEDPNCLKISVKDSGIGMTKEDTKKLFSTYTHIEFSDREAINPTGVGLGLSIAYNLARLLGPKGYQGITVESFINIGSTFAFIVENKEEKLDPQDLLMKNSYSDKSHGAVPDELHFTEPKVFSRVHNKCFSANFIYSMTERLLLDQNSERNLNIKDCKCSDILVVDDNPFNTMAFETVLDALNFKCDSVFDGRNAIDKILQRQNIRCGEKCKPYKVIFMDQEMPGMTGSETVRELKRLQMQYMISDVRIIGCTAHGSKIEVEKFMESGIEMCIQKPITVHELERILVQPEP